MDKDVKKVKRFVVILCFVFLCTAFLCFGISAYLVRAETANSFLVEIWKGAGILFLLLGFGYLAAVLISSGSRKKGSGDGGSTHAGNGSGTLDETNMRRALEKYIPDGETLLAGIHAVAIETAVNYVFGECLCMENRLIPHPGGGTYVLNKKKYEDHSVYIGITPHFLVMTDCGKESYYYQLDKIGTGSDVRETDVHNVTEELLLSEIGKCFSLEDIQDCDIQPGWLGSMKCRITMKNGSYLKLMFPKLGGLGGGMPHHTEYRDAIMARLGRSNVLPVQEKQHEK